MCLRFIQTAIPVYREGNWRLILHLERLLSPVPLLLMRYVSSQFPVFLLVDSSFLHQFFSWEIFTLSNPMEKQHNYQLNTTLLRRRGSFAGSIWPSLIFFNCDWKIFFNWFIQLWFIQPEGVTFRNYLGEPAMSSSREGSMASWFQWLALGSRAAMTSCLTSLLLVPSVCTSGKLIL